MLTLKQVVKRGDAAWARKSYSLGFFFLKKAIHEFSDGEFSKLSLVDQQKVKTRVSKYEKASLLTEDAYDAFYYFQDRDKCRGLIQQASEQLELPRLGELQGILSCWDARFETIRSARQTEKWDVVEMCAREILKSFPSNEEAKASLDLKRNVAELNDQMDQLSGEEAKAWDSVTERAILEKCQKAADLCRTIELEGAASALAAVGFQEKAAPRITDIRRRIEEQHGHLASRLCEEVLRLVRALVIAGALDTIKASRKHYSETGLPPDLPDSQQTRISQEWKGVESKIRQCAPEWTPAPMVWSGNMHDVLKQFVQQAEQASGAAMAAINDLTGEKRKDWSAALKAIQLLQDSFGDKQDLVSRKEEIAKKSKKVEQMREKFSVVKKCGFIDGRKQRKQFQILLMRPDAQAALSDTEKNTYKEFIRKKAKVMVAVCMAAAAVVGLVGAGVAFLIMPVL